MQTHTGTHRYTHSHVQTRAHAHKRTHAHKRAIVIGRVTHANQFHSLARCQVAMLSKYYHNSCVSEYAANEWMTWHPVKLRDTETEERNCPLTVTVPECLLHLPTVLLTSGSLCLFLSARFFLLSFFFLLFTENDGSEVGTAERKQEWPLRNLVLPQNLNWDFASSHRAGCAEQST